MEKSRIGIISLLSTISGLLIIESGIHFGLLQGQVWNIIAAGFEAGTVGGLADWFAVSALFREIPIPIIRKHTNIIVKNRKQLTEGIVNLVETKWLSPDIIIEKLSDINLIDKIIQFLKNSNNQTQVLNLSRNILERFAENLDKPELAEILQRLLKDQLEGIDIATPLGKWLEEAIKKGEHNQIWEVFLNSIKKTINEESTKKFILENVEKRIKEYKEEGLQKKALVTILELVRSVDADSITEKIIKLVNEFVEDAKNNPRNEYREKLDNSILEFVKDLQNEKSDNYKKVNDLLKKIVNNTEADSILLNILNRFKATIIGQLESNDTPMMSLLQKNFNNLISEIESNETTQNKINDWMRSTISNLVNEHHHEIGNMVRTSLEKLDNVGLVSQIEEKVGNDLQYIRLNGAVVGGLAGIIIAVIRYIVVG
ncbi:MAG: DUF445 domain-containing protein [Ignavibacteriales bacterium]|nr:DUF445 domain-containing protein [Ignavibacteriales bacterium]